jgi:hypothetical protein
MLQYIYNIGGGYLMKRHLLAFVCILIIAALSGCSLAYDSENVISKDNMSFYYPSSMSKRCFAGCYSWDGNKDSMNINIPDKIDGYAIKALGGYIGRGVPTPFGIKLPEELKENTVLKYTCDTPVGVPVEELHFTINIGANVKELKNIRFKDYYIYGDYIKDTYSYRVVVSISCSKKNKTFYSKDGKLYRSADDSLVDEFFYYGESTNSL